jgi:hypothetical protein
MAQPQQQPPGRPREHDDEALFPLNQLRPSTAHQDQREKPVQYQSERKVGWLMISPASP